MLTIDRPFSGGEVSPRSRPSEIGSATPDILNVVAIWADIRDPVKLKPGMAGRKWGTGNEEWECPYCGCISSETETLMYIYIVQRLFHTQACSQVELWGGSSGLKWNSFLRKWSLWLIAFRWSE